MRLHSLALLTLVVLFLLLARAPALAQDERTVVSPNGQLEFRLGLAQPEPGALFRLAYQIFFHGKPLIETSYMGLNIHFQEPLLGENVGLTASKASETAHYHSLRAEYMQNGSLGRRIDIEVRVADDGIAFRYVIPRSSPVEDLLLEDETTEFAFAGPGVDLSRIDGNVHLALPFVAQQPGVGWVGITEVGVAGYPRAWLARSGGTVLITRLTPRPSVPGIVFEAATPLTCPWRVVMVGTDREALMRAEILKDLGAAR